MPIVQIAANAINAKLINADKQTRLYVSNALSYMVAGAENMDKYKSHQWDGRSTFYDFKTDIFPAGFVNFIYQRLVQFGHDVQLIRNPLPEPLGPSRPEVDTFGYVEKYEYQPETFDALLKHGQMIAQVATGGGKSRIARIAYAGINRPTMFLTTRSVLMYQMRDSFQSDLGVRVGIMGDSEWSPHRGFNVAMVQTLGARLEQKTVKGEAKRYLEACTNREAKESAAHQAALKKLKYTPKQIATELAVLRKAQLAQRKTDKQLELELPAKVATHNERRLKTIKLLELFELVILEEAHEASGNTYYDIMRKCKNAYYRLSLTATPFMKEDEEANMRLMAVSGPIGIQVTERMLIDRGILAQPIFKYVQLPVPTGLHSRTAWPTAYKVGIVENQRRNDHIVWEARRAAQHKLPVMILIQREAHGKALEKSLKDLGVRAQFINGKSSHDTRQRALNKLKQRGLDVLIGSTILDVGVDVPAVGMVILGGGGKAEVALRQRIGRGLRAKKNSNVCFVVDFSDNGNKYTLEHAQQRRGIVDNIDGFSQHVLLPGQDFNFEM